MAIIRDVNLKDRSVTLGQVAEGDLNSALLAAISDPGGARVFTATPTPPYDVGDLWAQGASGDILTCSTAKTGSQSYNASDWELASKYTDDTLAGQANQAAVTAQTSASAAQTAADNAKALADTAQTTADNALANAANYIKNPQFHGSNLDSVRDTQMDASDSNAGTLPAGALTYGKNTGIYYDHVADAVRIRAIAGHTYRIEIDSKPASDMPSTETEPFGLMYWYLTDDNPGITANQYTMINTTATTVTDWTHSKMEFTYAGTEPWSVFRPAYRTRPTQKWLVTNFSCTDVTEIVAAQSTADKAQTIASAAQSAASAAQSSADAAKSAASAAQTAADNAKALANSLSSTASITYTLSNPSSSSKYWLRLGTLTANGTQGSIFQITLNVSKGNNGMPSQNAMAIIQVQKAWTGGDSAHQYGVSIDNSNWQDLQVMAMQTGTLTVDLWIYVSFGYLGGNYTISGMRGGWADDHVTTSTDAPSTGTAQTVAMNVSLEDVQTIADTAQTIANTANGRITVSTSNPTSDDATGKPEGAVWEVRADDAHTMLRRYVLHSGSWVQTMLGPDSIADNAVTPGKIAATMQQCGTASISNLSATDSVVSVTFSTAFLAAPVVFITANLAGTAPQVTSWVSDLTTTGCKLHAALVSGTVTSCVLQWLAVAA